MKKKRIQLIVLIIICLLSIGAYFLVKHLDLSETEETAPELLWLRIFLPGR